MIAHGHFAEGEKPRDRILAPKDKEQDKGGFDERIEGAAQIFLLHDVPRPRKEGGSARRDRRLLLPLGEIFSSLSESSSLWNNFVMIFPFEKFRLRPKFQAKAADVSECPQEMRSMLALTSSATLCITIAASSLLVKMEIAAALRGSQTALSSLMAG